VLLDDAEFRVNAIVKRDVDVVVDIGAFDVERVLAGLVGTVLENDVAVAVLSRDFKRRLLEPSSAPCGVLLPCARWGGVER
jgi:hypothetical protein